MIFDKLTEIRSAKPLSRFVLFSILKKRDNTFTTKAKIFEKGRYTQRIFYIYSSPIENIESFKYLGITLLKKAIGLEIKTE
jgi:hypothetical protein